MCKYEGCGKAFSNASDCAKHMNRTHSDEVRKGKGGGEGGREGGKGGGEGGEGGWLIC